MALVFGAVHHQFDFDRHGTHRLTLDGEMATIIEAISF